jgi:hypothetical protein
MKSLILIVLCVNLKEIFAIEPLLIVHGGAGSVAASRVRENLSENYIFKLIGNLF